MPKNAGNLIFELHFLKIFWGACSETPLGASAFGTCNQAPSAPSMLQYKSSPFSLGFPVFQTPSTSFTKVRVGSPELVWLKIKFKRQKSSLRKNANYNTD